jgi:hypothetical protein
VAGEGLGVDKLPTAYGTLSMSARQQGSTLRVKLEPGVRAGTAVRVSWPTRQRPTRVTIDGQAGSDYSADGITLKQPFRELVAEW